jgi:hypothetical protein
MPARALIPNADDLGRRPSADRGIFNARAALAGRAGCAPHAAGGGVPPSWSSLRFARGR